MAAKRTRNILLVIALLIIIITAVRVESGLFSRQNRVQPQQFANIGPPSGQQPARRISLFQRLMDMFARRNAVAPEDVALANARRAAAQAVAESNAIVNIMDEIDADENRIRVLENNYKIKV